MDIPGGGIRRVVGVRKLSLIILLLAACAAAPVANAADPERIIVTNARLVGRDSAVQDVAINILIVGGKLVVVSKDELAIEPGDVAVDSNGGLDRKSVV